MCFSWLRQCTTAIQVDAQRRLDKYKASCDNLISLSYPEDQRLEFGADATVTQSNAQGDLIAEGTVWCGTSLSGTRSTVLVTPKSGAFVTGIVLNFTTENGTLWYKNSSNLWFTSYLSDREQFVTLNGIESERT